MPFVARGLEEIAAGRTLDLENLCASAPDLVPAVAEALGIRDELPRLGIAADVESRAGRLPASERRVIAGRYRLEERIGAGAMGVVYRTFDEELGRWVALKRLAVPGHGPIRPELRARFLREAEVAAGIDHPHVVSVFDRGAQASAAGEDGEDELFVVMELLQGRSLAGVLAAASAYAEERGWRAMLRDTDWLAEALAVDPADVTDGYLRHVVRWIAEVSEGLESAHEAGVVHRDVKPSNIFIACSPGRAPRAVLLDFGIA